MIGTLVIIIILLIVIGVIAWAFWSYVPLSQPFKGIVMFLIILLGCVIILYYTVGGKGSLNL